MSKLYRVDMKIDISKLTPNSGLLMIQVPKEEDERGFKERTGAQVFALVCDVAIHGANPKCSYQQLKGFRKVAKDIQNAAAKAEFIANKTDLEVVKQSINGNSNWPNTDEIFDLLETVMDKLSGAVEINENPSAKT